MGGDAGEGGVEVDVESGEREEEGVAYSYRLGYHWNICRACKSAGNIGTCALELGTGVSGLWCGKYEHAVSYDMDVLFLSLDTPGLSLCVGLCLLW